MNYTHEQLIEWLNTHTIRGGIEAVVEDKVEDKTESKVEDKVEVVEEEEEDQESVEALRLYKALQNPTSAKQLIKILAAEAGMDLAGVETKTDKKDAKRGIQDYLKETLGDEYQFLGPKIGPAIDQFLNDKTKEIDERFANLRQEQVQRETDSAIRDITAEHQDFKLHEKRIVELMGEIAPSAKLTQKQYLTKLLILAREDAKSSTTSTNKGKKLTKATDDVPNRLRGTSVGGKESTNDTSRPLTRREAIRQTLEEIEAGENG